MPSGERSVAAFLNAAEQGAAVLKAKYQINRTLDATELQAVKRLLDDAWSAYAREQMRGKK